MADEMEIGSLHRLVAGEAIAERDHQAPILARIGIRNRRNLGGPDRPARVDEQRRVQAALCDAGVRRRRQLRPREIGLEELVGNDEAASGVTVEQVMPAGKPEITHASGLDEIAVVSPSPPLGAYDESKLGRRPHVRVITHSPCPSRG
jgi:hypothetical protein